LVGASYACFFGAVFRLAAAIAIEAQRLRLCNLQGDNPLDPYYKMRKKTPELG